MEKIRTCSYVRTSTDMEIQEGSFRLQKAYFEKLITADPNREYAGCYGDFGKSGRDADSRPEFQRMLRDCKAGKIQAIYTKSVSRFARNVADLVETVQLLREMGVCIYFEREGLNTMDRAAELLLHIFAILAQEESRSYGENIRLGLETRAATGHPIGRPPFGYRRVDKDAHWTVDAEAAKRIRLAFRMAGAGSCYRDIRNALDRMEQAAGTGRTWGRERLRRTLRNVAYKGDVLTCKTYTVGKRQRTNRGERPQYYLEGHHAPIVAAALFDRVQALMNAGLLRTLPVGLSQEQAQTVQEDDWLAAQDRLENNGMKEGCLNV